MEITTFKANGMQLFAMYTGGKYTVYSNYYGVMAICTVTTEEDDRTTEHVNMVLNTYYHQFKTAEISAIKRVIRKEENKYISKKITFSEEYHSNKQFNIFVTSEIK